MNPRRLEITDERKEKIKSKYKYSSLSVYDVSFLDAYEERIICEFFPENRHEEIRTRLKKISEFVVSDRLKNNINGILCSKDAIHFDNGIIDVVGDSFNFKKEYPYTDTLLYHSLLHAASRSDDKNGVIDDKNNVGLNEGITSFLAKKITGINVPNEVDGCFFNQQVVSILVDTLGLDVVTSSYFDHTNDLKNELNKLAGDSEFYDKFNRKLDTITKLSATITRIEIEKQKPADDVSLDRMKIILEKQQEALMESVFANVILPNTSKIEVDKRSYKLLDLAYKYQDVFPSIMKYIPQVSKNNMVDLSDERFIEIKRELEDYGMDFKKIQESVKKIDLDRAINSSEVHEVLSSASSVYEENTEQLKIERSSLLTPSLERELIKFVDILDMLEEEATRVNQSVNNYVEFIRASFPGIDIDKEIARIREEKKKKNEEQKKPDEKTNAESLKLNEAIEKIIDEVSQIAERDATKAIHQKNDDENKKKDNAPINNEEPIGLKKDFVVSNLTGEVYEQKDLTLYQKAVNISACTGELVPASDPLSLELCEEYAERYLENFEPSQDLIMLYGENGWRDVIKKAYYKGWNKGMTSQMEKAHQEGMTTRSKTEECINQNIPLAEENRPITFDEMKFIEDKFSIDDDGELKITRDGKEVISERTKNAVIFTKVFQQATGKNKITEDDREVYEFIFNSVTKNLKTNDAINYDEIRMNAMQKGKQFEKTFQELTKNSERCELLENYFRSQIKNAEVTQKETSVAK